MADEEDKTTNRRVKAISLSNRGKYTIDSLCYPSDVSNQSDLSHYVTFYINVRQSSKFETNKRIGFVTNEGQNRTGGGNYTKEALVAIPTLAAGIGGYSLLKGLASGEGSTVRAAAQLGIAGGAVAGAAIGAVAKATFDVEKTQRISDAITLAVQSSPSTSYGVEWEVGGLGSVLGTLAAGGSSAVDATSSAGNITSDLARRFAETLASTPTAITGSDQVQSFIQSSTKKVANPQKEQLFKNVGFRTFQFKYQFMPKSTTETENIRRIINKFKFHMHPELSASGIYYIYPSEFDIQYYYRGKENEYIHKISSCALTNMEIDYGGNQFSTFADGSPVLYNLTLTFVELETLTKERIQEGY